MHIMILSCLLEGRKEERKKKYLLRCCCNSSVMLFIHLPAFTQPWGTRPGCSERHIPHSWLDGWILQSGAAHLLPGWNITPSCLVCSHNSGSRDLHKNTLFLSPFLSTCLFFGHLLFAFIRSQVIQQALIKRPAFSY